MRLLCAGSSSLTFDVDNKFSFTFFANSIGSEGVGASV